MKKITSILFALIPLLIFSQKQGNIWMFAGNNGLDFNSGSPVLINNNVIPSSGWVEGTTSISDSSGNLLFFSDGETIWNKNQQIMPHGNNLMGGTSACQAAFIIPIPNNDSLFYIFTLDEGENFLANGLRYSIVNMCRDGGLGDIDTTKKNILLLDTVAEKQAATFHANSKDIWLVVHKYFSDAFYAYLITANGISSPVISHTGTYHPMDSSSVFTPAAGHMRISPDGSKLAIISSFYYNLNDALIELFEFDNSTGIISNPVRLSAFDGQVSKYAAYGVSFSPDNSKLYACNMDYGVVQWDLGSGNPVDIIASYNVVFFQPPLGMCDMQLGPDGKIYISTMTSTNNKTLSVINYPNLLGNACGFVQDGVWLNNYAFRSLPGFIDSYKYKNGMVNCTPPSINATAIIQDIPCLDECSGTALAITAEGTPPYTYTWSTVPVQTTQTATGLCAGNYSVTITDSKGVSGTASVTVVNNPKPVPVTDTTNFTLQCTPSYSSYQWYFNGIAISGATGQSYIPLQNGNYTVEVTDSNGCTGFSAAYNVVWVNIAEYAKNNAINISPNPANSVLSIEFATVGAQNIVPVQTSHCRVYDILGTTVIEKTFTGNKINLNVRNLPKGLYLVRVESGRENFVRRFVKE